MGRQSFPKINNTDESDEFDESLAEIGLDDDETI
jgi:hypothetical protein